LEIHRSTCSTEGARARPWPAFFKGFFVRPRTDTSPGGVLVGSLHREAGGESITDRKQLPADPPKGNVARSQYVDLDERAEVFPREASAFRMERTEAAILVQRNAIGWIGRLKAVGAKKIEASRSGRAFHAQETAFARSSQTARRFDMPGHCLRGPSRGAARACPCGSPCRSGGPSRSCAEVARLGRTEMDLRGRGSGRQGR